MLDIEKRLRWFKAEFLSKLMKRQRARERFYFIKDERVAVIQSLEILIE
jgi:hypothetical protein